jgi:uncharacterized protein (DUF983 family)
VRCATLGFGMELLREYNSAMSIWSTFRSFFAMRCPRCHRGPIYQSAFELHKTCPSCGLVYEREPGYFVGSLYVGYTFGIVILGTLTLIGSFIFPNTDLFWIVLVAIAIFVPFVPATTRYARVLWMYVDRAIWPTQPGETDSPPPNP